MAIQYAPLFALETQFQTKDGRNNTGGWLKVFLAATDDPATTYSDYNGTRNPEKIVLDDDGRALVICDKSKAYRLEVYSMDGSLLWTEEPVYCSGTGGGGISITKVVSTDGSISVDKNVAGSTTTYDLGISPSSDEFLEWIKCYENDCGATWYPVFQDGSMETEAGKGIKVHGGHLYHFTNSFTVDPDGTGVNYDTFRVIMYCGDDIVDEHDFDIDSSLNDPVLCEFSRDVVPSEDTHVYFKLTIPSTCKASGEVQCHRIYSGINAVPDTCATKQWASGSFQPLGGMSSYVPYSAIDNNGIGQVTGINGSAIVGGFDSASVSSIASSVASAYTESAFSSLSSKADSSALSAYQPVSAMGAYATTAYVDGMVSGKLDTSAFNSSDFYPTSNPSGYITGVDLTPYQEKSAMTAYQPSGNYYSASNPSGFITGVDLSDYATTGFVESSVSGKLDTTAFNPGDFYTTANESGFVGRAYVDSSVSGKLDTTAFASASAGFQPTGDYAYNSALTAYIPASASGEFQPSGDYAFNSAVSSKLDASASGDFVANSAMTSWIPYSALGYSGTAISGIGGSSLAGMGGGGVTGDYVEKSSTEVAIGSGSTALETSFAQGNNCGASSTSFAQGYSNSAKSGSFAQGENNSARLKSFAQGDYNSADMESFAQGARNSAILGSFAQGMYSKAAGYSVAQGDFNKAESGSFAQGSHNIANVYSFAQGSGNSAVYTAAVFGTYNLHGNGSTSTGDSAAFAIGDGTAANARHDLMLVTKDGEITMYSSTADTIGIGLVSSIKAISAAATGGVDSATVSAIASAYTTGKQDTLAFAYNTADQISSINGSALAGQGGVTGDYVEKSSVPIGIGSSINANNTSIALGSLATADDMGVAIGRVVSASHNSVAIGGRASAGLNSFSFGWYSTANFESVVMGSYSKAVNDSTTLGYGSYATDSAVAIGHFLSAGTNNTVFGRYNSTANSANTVFSIGDGNGKNARHNLLEIAKDGEITMFSSTADTVGTGIMSSIRAISAAASGGVDSAAVSGIASAYAQSAASGKLDTTAFNSGDFYSTANPSGFITGVDLTPYQPTSAMSGYIPTSMSSDFQQVAGMSSYALSADVSATVDLVGTQSANWGGSALQLSAGPGVKLEKSGNVLVAGLDETVLWSTSTYNKNISSITLSEPASAFEVVRIMDSKNHVQDYYPNSGTSAVYFSHNTYILQWEAFWSFCSNWSGMSGNEGWLSNRSGSTISGGNAVGPAAPYGRWITPMKIVGINRTAGV